MAKTRASVIARALQRLGVLAKGVAPDQSEHNDGSAVLDGIVAELTSLHGVTIDPDAVPDAVYLSLAHLVSVDLAPDYEIQPRDSRAALIGRIRAYGLPDDREDRRDLDDDGIISDAEIWADGEAVYY